MEKTAIAKERDEDDNGIGKKPRRCDSRFFQLETDHNLSPISKEVITSEIYINSCVEFHSVAEVANTLTEL